ncbi:uncharacterized protein LOC142175749 [Nicotiana tabacum]|uniref:Uncharacterized protein LOC142175749 n=1 Tax=Nicotiana tabacum TaxID=4097 RepID=A0AC58TNN1_TOBAC
MCSLLKRSAFGYRECLLDYSHLEGHYATTLQNVYGIPDGEELGSSFAKLSLALEAQSAVRLDMLFGAISEHDVDGMLDTIEELSTLGVMAKGTRSTENATEESDLRELMQKLVADVGALAGEVSNLDQTVLELKEQLTHSGENRRDKTPMQHEGEPSDERSPREKSPASYNHHNCNFSRWSRMEFLRFNGEDLKSWLFKIEQFFSMEKVPAEERVEVAAMQLEGEAIQWHLVFMRYRQYLKPATWTEYVMAMMERFGVDFDDPMEEIKKIRQTGTVKEYQAVYKTARIQEAYLAAIRQPSLVSYTPSNAPRKIMDQRNNNRSLLPTPSQGNVVTSKGFSRRTLSIEEMNEKRAKGLCYFCNEKYVLGHKCKNAKQIYVLELEGMEENHDTEVEGELILQEEEFNQLEPAQPIEQMEIFIHALNGSLGYRTLKVTGYHAKKALNILIDTGSSHNFIDPDLVHHLECKIRSTTPQMVAAANGNMMVDRMCTITWLLQGAEFSAEFLLLPLGSCGVVLAVQWLLTLGDIKMNFKKLTMEFWYRGKKHLLRGAGNQVKVQEAGRIAKHTGNTSQLCMIQVVPMESVGEQWHSHKAKEEPKTDVRLTQLLSEYSKLFEEPTELPPSRGVFDYRIVLQSGTEPVNKRPYRYPSVKKDIIEGLVQQMLDQGIIQPSCSPFASPVVLVGKKDEAVRNWPTPTTLKQLKGFLGLAGYYRRFIKGFGVICKPLTELTKKNNFKWSTIADATFVELKEALTQAPVLAFPDASKAFIVETDASGSGIGAMLMQEGHPIAFIIKALSPRHAALSVYDRELLAVVHAVSKWSQYLLG